MPSMLFYNKFTNLLYSIFIIVYLSPVRSLSSQPIYSSIGANTMQVGSKTIVVQSLPVTLGSRNYSVTYSQSISNPKLVLGINKLSILLTSSPSSYNNKYLLAYPLAVTSTGFTSKVTIFTNGTVIYNVIVQYLVYNNLDSLVQSLQMTSLYSSITSTQFIIFSQNYHEETLIMDRTFTAPTNIRYYPSNPTCAVLSLGHKIQTTDVFKFVNANCTMQYGSNEANVMIYASDNALVDTYVGSVFGIVVPQGRYFGYFQDVIDYSYVAVQNSSNSIIATNTNISKQYFMLNINNYNRLSTSQFSIDIQSSLPTLMSGISIPIFYSIQGILIQNCLLQYTQQFNTSTYTLNIANGQQSAHSIIPTTYVAGYNMGYLFSFGTVQCSNAYYFDAITSLCYQFWTGGDRQCTGLQYMGRMDYAIANPSYDVDFVMFSNRNLGKAINSDSFTVMAYSSKGPSNWQLWLLTSTTPSAPGTYTSADTGIIYSQCVINTSKISETSTNTTLNSLQLVYTGSNQYVIYGNKLYSISSGNSSLMDQIADLTIAYNNTDKIIWSQMVKLTDINSQIKSSFTSLYNYTINNQSSPNPQQNSQYQLLTTVNSQFLMDIFLISNAQPATAINLYSYANSASQILNYIQADTNIANLTASDILDNIQVQSQAIRNRIAGTVLKLSSTINTNQYQVSETVEFVIDKYMFIYQIQLHFTLPGSSATVASSTITLIQSKTFTLSISGQQYPSDSSQIPNVYIRQLTINKPNYTAIPEYYNLSQYTYMEAYYSDNYYKNRQLYITYVLSDGEITSYGALMSGLSDKYLVDLSVINLTVNYSYVYDCWGDSIFDQNISSAYQYMNSPYSLYNTYYNSSNNNYNFYQLTVDKTINQAHSTILSQLGNQGNPSAINQFGTNPSAKANNILLLTTTSGSHNSIDIVSTQENLFILTNTNLLYIYEKQQLQTLSSSNSNSVGNRTIFQGYKLVRMVDIYKYLIQKIPESGTGLGQIAISIQVDQINGILYIGTSKGRLYKIQCGWGYTTNKFDAVTSLNNREYVYKYRQLNLPPPPVPNITNTTNSTNSSNATTVANTTNVTNTTNTTNNTSINNPISPSIQPETQSVAQTQQLSQTNVIIISVICSVVGVACLFAFYFLFIKPTKIVKVNPQMVSRTKHSTKTSFNDITQLGQKTDHRAQRITSGKTEATLLQFQPGSQGNISPDKILKLKKTKEPSLTNLQIQQFSSRDSPYGTGQRGLIKQKDRIFVIQDMEI